MPVCRGLQPRWLCSLLVPASCLAHILPLMGITYGLQRSPLPHKTPVHFLVQFASELCKLQKTIMLVDWLLNWLRDFFMPSWQTSTQLAHIGRKWWGQQQGQQWPTLDKESTCSPHSFCPDTGSSSPPAWIWLELEVVNFLPESW